MHGPCTRPSHGASLPNCPAPATSPTWRRPRHSTPPWPTCSALAKLALSATQAPPGARAAAAVERGEPAREQETENNQQSITMLFCSLVFVPQIGRASCRERV